MSDLVREYMTHAASWLRPSTPSRKRVLRVRPLDFLAPDGYTIGGLSLEPAMAFYRYLAVSAIKFDHVGQLLSGHGTCVGRELPRPIYIAPPFKRQGPIVINRDGETTPGRILTAELRYRFRHALLGPCHASGWKWRESVNLLPDKYTIEQRHFIPWRADICGADMDKKIDALGNLATRKFLKSPNQYHRRAVHAHDLALEVTRWGYVARLFYGYSKESSSWSVDAYSVPRETFAEFVERATVELSDALMATKHPTTRECTELRQRKYQAHIGKGAK